MPVGADAFNAREIAERRLTMQHVSSMTALWQEQHGLVVDGKCGPSTRRSIEDELGDTPAPATAGEPADQADGWDHGFDGPLESIPRSRAEVYATFGNPGTVASPNSKWRKQSIITVRDLPGLPTRWHFQVHRLAEPYAREAFRRASIASGYRIERAGCFVLRHVQHNASKPLSLHSWGIAIDIDPTANRARRFAPGTAPCPWDDEWTELWPRGVDRELVEAFESAGFTWGGVWGRAGSSFAERSRAVSFVDPMHFELVQRA